MQIKGEIQLAYHIVERGNQSGMYYARSIASLSSYLLPLRVHNIPP
ncbi:hypothetical protein J7K07_04540 [Candidatus Bathyarchaeota archaeon]|nr:hypothetical protein [Candidatus Bathyarchaeota archaeon]